MASGMCTLHYTRTRSGMSFDAPVLGAGQEAGCAVDGCDKPYHSTGYCALHAQRYKRTGDPLGFLRDPRPEVCTVTDCGGAHFGLGYCAPHYHRTNRLGSPTAATCRRCGSTFDRPIAKTGSYHYCTTCIDIGPHAWAAMRRERRAAANADLTADDWAEAKAYRALIFADPCVYCGGTAQAIDHIVPVMAGGSDRWDNAAPTCHSCNSSKKTRSVLGFLMFRAGAGERRAA